LTETTLTNVVFTAKKISREKSFLLEKRLGGEMKNKDRMQFNLKNWEKRGFFGNFWDKNDKRATLKKILNKDKYKKK
jgi:hypothetical protein